MPEAKTYVVSYDVSDDKRRAKLAKFLESRGSRVQFSVFEIVASAEEMKEIFLQASRPPRFDPDTDSLRVYALCATCRQNAWAVGQGPAPAEPDVPLVL